MAKLTKLSDTKWKQPFIDRESEGSSAGRCYLFNLLEIHGHHNSKPAPLGLLSFYQSHFDAASFTRTRRASRGRASAGACREPCRVSPRSYREKARIPGQRSLPLLSDLNPNPKRQKVSPVPAGSRVAFFTGLKKVTKESALVALRSAFLLPRF